MSRAEVNCDADSVDDATSVDPSLTKSAVELVRVGTSDSGRDLGGSEKRKAGVSLRGVLLISLADVSEEYWSFWLLGPLFRSDVVMLRSLCARITAGESGGAI